MPYSLYDLNEMSREQLEEIASKLEVKFSKKTDIEALAFGILDYLGVVTRRFQPPFPFARRSGLDFAIKYMFYQIRFKAFCLF